MSKTSKIISMAAILLLAVLAVSLSPANVAKAGCNSDCWVAPQPLGNDLNPGTQAQPFEHIQYGINFICLDGTVHVAPGFYDENLVISSQQNLVGSGAPVTIIDGKDCDVVVRIGGGPSEKNTISGFTIQNGNQLIWNPIKQQVLYAGIKLPSFEMLSQMVSGEPNCGGGIYIADSHIVTLNDCVIKDNGADKGGGICNQGQLYMNRCTVSGNTAEHRGGGIFNVRTMTPDSGKMWLTNCTISGNNVYDLNGEGGGIWNGGTMELLNCTIANNYTFNDSGSIGGGFVNRWQLTAIFKNTIVANNTAGNPATNNCYNSPEAVIISLGHNLDSENSCQFNGTGDLVNTNPLLGPLQDNGGPTFTHALLQDSPAINAGDNNGAPATDQRGITRPQGISVDIGAYELVNPVVAPTQAETHPSYSPPMPNINRYLNPATMSVQFVSVSPRQATASQPVTISTNVVNTGDESGNLNVELKINGKVEQMRMVSVGPQATQPIKFTVTKDQPGTYSVDIGGQTGSFTIPGAPSSRAPVSSGLIAVLIVGVLILTAVMVLVLSRRTA